MKPTWVEEVAGDKIDAAFEVAQGLILRPHTLSTLNDLSQ